MNQQKRRPIHTAQTKSGVAILLDKAIVVFLFVFAVAAPNSIAVTQTAWLVGMALWLAKFIVADRRALYRTPVDYLLFGFFILTGLSSFLSYEPFVSIGKLRAASLFTIVYLFAQNIPSRRVLRLLVITLIAGCMANVVFTGAERLRGRGVRVDGVSTASPLYKMGVRDGDTLLTVNSIKLHDAQQLLTEISGSDKSGAIITAFRLEWIFKGRVRPDALLPRNTVEEQLGITGWSTGRDWRASGFYGNYVTYAESLQLILALAIGLLVSLRPRLSRTGLMLMLAIAGMFACLILTVTRASWLAFAVSTTLILLLGMGRRAVLIAGLLAIPLVLSGLFLLKEKRNVGFIDQADKSTSWRETVWREGFHLLISKPRHLLVGVGMDSIKSRWPEWGMFDKGRLPWSHLHSNLLQIAVERGVPALLVWLGLLFVYGRTIWRTLRFNQRLDWVERGLLFGALGGLAGFFVSGVVHYNWGDSEVVMIFYFTMGLVLALHHKLNTQAD